jgi:DNA-directed RNA polymerase specialized sigma24 family protein
MDTYRVTAVREDAWWSLVAHDVGGREVASQARRLDQADAVIREAIALVLDIDAGSFEVDVTPDVASVPMSDGAREAIELRAALAALSERVHRATPVAVAELRAAGLTVRDVARLLGVTASRVSQIEQRGRGGAEGTRPVA